MLVITRREGEEVVIGDPHNPIGVVRIASIKGDRVRIAFDFPRSIDVHRREVANQILSGGAEPTSSEPALNGAPAGHMEITIELGGHGSLNGHASPAPRSE